MYVTAQLDRANVSFANLRMSVDLGFSDRVYGLGVGMFFLGYVIFEAPGAVIVERWSARKCLARIMIAWGLTTECWRYDELSASHALDSASILSCG
jgi:MFS transporter, ACS family, tartrate transporter